VGSGRDNFLSGVLAAWAEAAPRVVGVSGAIHAKCRSWEEAQAFVADAHAQLQKRRAENHDGTGGDSNLWYAVVNCKTSHTGIYPTWGEASVHVTGISGANGANTKNFRSYQEAKVFLTVRHKKAREEVRRAQEESLVPEPQGWDVGMTRRGDTIWAGQAEGGILSSPRT
jgi:viroplasmin and RNaseH domain-containing protein